MDASDTELERIVRDWVASEVPERADVILRPESRGGPAAFEVRPRNRAALSIILWVADHAEHVAFSIGEHSWWDSAVPLEDEPIREVLSAVAAADAGEEIRQVGGYILARRGYVNLNRGGRLTYGQLNPFSIIPGLKWSPIAYEPY